MVPPGGRRTSGVWNPSRGPVCACRGTNSSRAWCTSPETRSRRRPGTSRVTSPHTGGIRYHNRDCGVLSSSRCCRRTGAAVRSTSPATNRTRRRSRRRGRLSSFDVSTSVARHHRSRSHYLTVACSVRRSSPQVGSRNARSPVRGAESSSRRSRCTGSARRCTFPQRRRRSLAGR